MNNTATTDYRLLASQVEALLDGEPDPLANTANMTALLFGALDDVNWLGIYVLRGVDLVLGPFQGKPACVRIPLGSGVCGVAAESAQTLRVDDVHAFDGHIVCDPDSRSELVVPLQIDGKVVGVLDIDSPLPARFTADDQVGIEQICETYLRAVTGAAESERGFI